MSTEVKAEIARLETIGELQTEMNIRFEKFNKYANEYSNQYMCNHQDKEANEKTRIYLAKSEVCYKVLEFLDTLVYE